MGIATFVGKRRRRKKKNDLHTHFIIIIKTAADLNEPVAM